jgi:two-component system, OmpR family, phosphate regulon sensor histidine kinase PhoR
MFRSIRWRIAVPYVLLSLITMLAVSFYLSGSVRQFYISDLRRQLTNECALLTDIMQPVLDQGDRTQLVALAQRYAAEANARLTIVAADGTVLADTFADASTEENHLTRPEVQQALLNGQGYSMRLSATENQQMMYAAVRLGTPSAPTAVVRLAIPVTTINARIFDIDRTLVAATLGAQILIMIVAVYVAERTTLPVRQLTSAVDQMAMGNMGVRLLPTTADEVGRLSEAFNNMAERVESQVATVTDQRNKLTAVLTYMTDGAVITDRQGHVQLMNPAASRLLGLPMEGAIGASLVSVVRDHQIAGVWQRSRDTRKEQSDVVDVGARGAFLRVVATPLQEPSGGGSLLILQDLTQVRRLETIRRDFISNISHELRNPLAALKALVDTLRDVALDDRPMAERFLSQMDGEVDAMTQMVRELLELSRIESGKVPLRLALLAVAALVNPAVERLQPQAERAGLSMSIELPGDLPQVTADGERLQQVLSNLLHNAIKFTPPGGHITVSARKSDKVIISVHDTGVGIAASDLSRIFERFYKADRARSSGGTGLGLAIAKHIVQAHGGQIWAESVEGEGATFYFTLPIAP